MEEYRERLSGTVEVTHLSGATATTTDALLLAAFLPHCRERSLELGAGCGIVTILAAARGRLSHGELCERDMTLSALCEKNLAGNRLGDRFFTVCRDLRLLSGEGRYELIYANPPYRRAGEGKPAANPLADIARFERYGTVVDFCAAAARLLSADGQLCTVFPTARRGELFDALALCGLCPHEEVTVFPYPGGSPKLFLVRADRHAGALCRRRVTLATAKGGRQTEAARILYTDGRLLTEGEPV